MIYHGTTPNQNFGIHGKLDAHFLFLLIPEWAVFEDLLV